MPEKEPTQIQAEKPAKSAKQEHLTRRDYYYPLLYVLANNDTLTCKEALAEVEKFMDDRLGDYERQKVSNGETRWVRAVSWARQDFRNMGYLDSAKRGQWGLTVKGKAAFEVGTEAILKDLRALNAKLR